MRPHNPECEKAEPGSECDCDCAGARHAVRRTAGGTAAAGSVSRRARQIAARQGRAAVVNNITRTDPAPAGGGPTAVRTAARTPRLSPVTAAKIRQVRDGLPKTRDDWHAAAVEPVSPARRDAIAAQLAEYRDQVAAAEAATQALIDEHATKEAAKIARSREGKAGHYGTREQIAATARAVAPHRAWDDPRWDELTANLSAARSTLFTAEREAERQSAAAYPVDEKSRLRMPSADLRKHLASVVDTGRAALAEAKAAWEKDPPRPVVDAQDLIARHTAAAEALQALTRRQKRLTELDTGGRWFSVPLPEPDGTVIIKSREQFTELQTRWGQQLLAVGGVARLREARATIAKHQSDTLHAMLAEHRRFGGSHTDVSLERDPHGGASNGPTRPREDSLQRLAVAENYFPADWIRASSAKPLKIGASQRAYYNDIRGHLSMNVDAPGDTDKDGGLHYIDEVTVHELGHRMETVIPGLTHLEFAYVRQRGVQADGSVQPIQSLGYADAAEVAQPDKWGNAYAGKTYEGRNRAEPGGHPWEVFQVGLQDTWSRSSAKFGPVGDPDELQAFVIGALLTLG